MNQRPLKILIADDHPIFRRGLRQLLEGERRLDAVVEEASDGSQVLELFETGTFNLVILDIEMPGKNGLEVVRTLRDHRNACPVIFLTMYDDEELFDEALDLGVMGYVLKENAVHDILDAVHAVLSGKPYISALMSSAMLKGKAQAEQLRQRLPAIDMLTTTERRVLRLIAEGKTSKQIAEEFHISAKTVDNHRTTIASKLNIHGRHNLLKFALRHRPMLFF
jgi:DNA-binding NarL/FixJ family response regulator